MSYTLHTKPASHQAFKILIAAEYNGVDVEIAENFDAAKVASLSPTGKGPILETPRGILFESNAIARFLAKIRSDTGLMGQNVFEEAEVDSWVDFAAREVELPACVWFYPVAGYMPFNEDAYKKAKIDFGKALALLELQLKDKKYLVGDQITLADIAVVSSLVYPMKLVCDKAYVEPYPNVVRWFQSCVDESNFKNVIGVTTMCKKEITAPGQAKAAAPKADK
uniref:GST C-terminal domain-containing protein n=1 Tax=Ditylum brightwellii TaxID=49249 RepID=A0A6U3WYA0_9STRA|mmetsp:Transcript_6271/g.8247  ORF Transcript_6271/g.8247 Transcript_6271/m.8247 type:complete len:223 (-) Transcript_6271:512-1180(-)